MRRVEDGGKKTRVIYSSRKRVLPMKQTMADWTCTFSGASWRVCRVMPNKVFKANGERRF